MKSSHFSRTDTLAKTLRVSYTWQRHNHETWDMTRHGNSRQRQDKTYKCRDWAKTETWKAMSRDSFETRHMSRDSITGKHCSQISTLIKGAFTLRRSLSARVRTAPLHSALCVWTALNDKNYTTISIAVAIIVDHDAVLLTARQIPNVKSKY